MHADVIRPPKKILVERPVNNQVDFQFRAKGLQSWMSSLLSRRLEHAVEIDDLLSPSLSTIADPVGIPSMILAVDRIVDAIGEQHRIVLACDHDMDGTASAAVLWTALVHYFHVPTENIKVVTSHRLREGYGLTSAVVDRILSWKPDLVITADKGSTDEPRIALLAQNGIDVIVTDHHQIPSSGPPSSAVAVVNPARSDSTYDPHVCGAGVAFLVMAKVRTALLDKSRPTKIASLSGLLDYVAVATIADCVSLSPNHSSINRTFVHYGLKLINGGSRPCWEQFRSSIGFGYVDAESIAFRLAPAIAASGRLDWADVGFRFLVASSKSEAETSWETLQKENLERRAIERDLRERAIQKAMTMKTRSIIIYFEDGHAGVHGITASRLVETFGKPAGLFAPKGAGTKDGAVSSTELASGSFRSIPGFNVHEAIRAVAASEPDLVVSHGGHQGAAGAVVPICAIDRFAQAFEREVSARLTDLPQPIVLTDGELATDLHTISGVESIEQFGPWGRGFEYPVFSGSFRVVGVRPMSDGKHVRLGLTRDGHAFEAVWFNFADEIDEGNLMEGGEITIAYRMKVNRFRGRESLELFVVTGFTM